VVDAYNAQSGVAAPIKAPSATAKPDLAPKNSRGKSVPEAACPRRPFLLSGTARRSTGSYSRFISGDIFVAVENMCRNAENWIVNKTLQADHAAMCR